MKTISTNNTAFYHIVAILTVMIWGTTFISTKKLLVVGMQPEEIFFMRFLLAYICIWFISPRKLFAESWKDEVQMALLGFFGGTLFFVAENKAVGFTYVNDVSFIGCTAPLMTVMLALIFFRDSVKMSWKLLIGSIIAMAGVGVVIFNGQFVLHVDLRGYFLALFASFSWAIYSLIMKRVSSRYSAVFITRKVFFYGVLGTLPFFLISPWTFPLSGFLDLKVYGNLLFLGVLASFACFATWSWAIAKLGALKTSNYIYLNPITTVIASAIFLDEPMTLMAYLGSALILIGVYFANKAEGI